MTLEEHLNENLSRQVPVGRVFTLSPAPLAVCSRV